MSYCSESQSRSSHVESPTTSKVKSFRSDSGIPTGRLNWCDFEARDSFNPIHEGAIFSLSPHSPGSGGCDPVSEAGQFEGKEMSSSECKLACELLAQGKGEVTTIMIRNLPRRKTQVQLVNKLAADGFADDYDVLFLPYSFKRWQNLGYAFINFRKPGRAQAFFTQWHKTQNGKEPLSRKLTLSPARVQGKQANVDMLMREARAHMDLALHPIVFKDDGMRMEFII